jgi:hypothetical protein
MPSMEEGVKIVIEYIKTNAAEYEKTYFSLLTQNGRRGKIHFVLKKNIWVWRSLVACLNGVQEVASSNLVTQTIEILGNKAFPRFFYCSKCTNSSLSSAQ